VTPPALEIADLIRTAGAAFVERNRRWIRWKHVKVLLAIARCRTAALGGHLDECTRCAHRAPISYNSCRKSPLPKVSDHCPRPLDYSGRKELLPTRYVHVVFTLLRHLAPLVLQNKKVLYDLPVSHQCGNPSGSRSQSQTSRRGNRLLQRAAPLESKTRNSPACPLRRSCRRMVARSHPLGSRIRMVLSSHELLRTDSIAR